MYKLIACDLDETLLNTQKEICERNVAAIKKAEQKYGVRFVPATGRGYTCIDTVLHTLGVYDAKNEYTISNNGGVVTENKDYRELTFHELSYDIVAHLFQFGLDKDVCMQIFTAKDVFAFHLNEDEHRWLYACKPDFIACEKASMDFLKGTPITKILFQNTDTNYLRTLAQELRPYTEGKVTVSFSSHRYLEFNPIGIDKGVGLRELCEALHIDLADTIAIGDNYNDAGMLKVAGLSVAVANAVEDIKQLCDVVTTADHNEGAVAEVIERFIFQAERGEAHGGK